MASIRFPSQRLDNGALSSYPDCNRVYATPSRFKLTLCHCTVNLHMLHVSRYYQIVSSRLRETWISDKFNLKGRSWTTDSMGNYVYCRLEEWVNVIGLCIIIIVLGNVLYTIAGCMYMV